MGNPVGAKIGSSEIISFDPSVHNPSSLGRSGLFAVALAQPHHVIRPGLQMHAAIKLDGEPDLGETGLVYADPAIRTAAGRIVQQVAYDCGLQPGHAGVHHPDSSILASPQAKEAMRARGTGGDWVGYLALVPWREIEGVAGNFGNTPHTRRTFVATAVVGLTLSDLNTSLGPEGIDGLRDPVDHPTVRRQLAMASLRPERLQVPTLNV